MLEDLLSNLPKLLEHDDPGVRRRGLSQTLHRLVHDVNSPLSTLLLEVQSLDFAAREARTEVHAAGATRAVEPLDEVLEIGENLAGVGKRLQALTQLLVEVANELAEHAG